MGPRRVLSQAVIAARPETLWNAFVDLLAMSKLDELEPRQRAAHLAFWYDSEIQNGGHLQYFANRGLEVVPETVRSLKTLGAHAQADILAEAHRLAAEQEWDTVTSVEDFVAESLEGGFSRFDDLYQSCAPTVLAVLEEHLEHHKEWYIAVGAA